MGRVTKTTVFFLAFFMLKVQDQDISKLGFSLACRWPRSVCAPSVPAPLGSVCPNFVFSKRHQWNQGPPSRPHTYLMCFLDPVSIVMLGPGLQHVSSAGGHSSADSRAAVLTEMAGELPFGHPGRALHSALWSASLRPVGVFSP